MSYIEIDFNQEIYLKAKSGATPAQALVAAHRFAVEHKTAQCTLAFNGFEFGIEQDSDLAGMLSEYYTWLDLKSKHMW